MSKELEHKRLTIKMLESNFERYNDKADDKAQRISLIAAIAKGLEHNPTLAKAYAAIQQNQWEAIAIRREWYPALSIVTYNPGAIGFNSNYPTTSSSSNAISSPELQLEWIFFDPSRATRSLQVQSATKANELLFDISARDLLLDIQKAYFSLQSLHYLEGNYEQPYLAVKRLAATMAAEHARHSDSADFQQVLGEQLNLLSLLINTHARLLIAASQLASLLSLEPGQLAIPSQSLAPLGDWVISRDETIQQALALREEIQRSLDQANSLDWRATSILKGSLPRLSLAASSNIEQGTNTYYRDITNNIGIKVRWNVFDGGIRAAQTTAVRRQALQLRDEAALDRLNVVREVEVSHTAYRSSLIAIPVIQQELQSTKKAQEIAFRQSQGGRNDGTTLVQTIERSRKACEGYALAIETHNSAIAELYRYSSRWPSTAEPLLRKRQQVLKQR